MSRIHFWPLYLIHVVERLDLTYRHAARIPGWVLVRDEMARSFVDDAISAARRAYPDENDDVDDDAVMARRERRARLASALTLGLFTWYHHLYADSRRDDDRYNEEIRVKAAAVHHMKRAHGLSPSKPFNLSAVCVVRISKEQLRFLYDDVIRRNSYATLLPGVTDADTIPSAEAVAEEYESTHEPGSWVTVRPAGPRPPLELMKRRTYGYPFSDAARTFITHCHHTLARQALPPAIEPGQEDDAIRNAMTAVNAHDVFDMLTEEQHATIEFEAGMQDGHQGPGRVLLKSHLWPYMHQRYDINPGRGREGNPDFEGCAGVRLEDAIQDTMDSLAVVVPFFYDWGEANMVAVGRRGYVVEWIRQALRSRHARRRREEEAGEEESGEEESGEEESGEEESGEEEAGEEMELGDD